MIRFPRKSNLVRCVNFAKGDKSSREIYYLNHTYTVFYFGQIEDSLECSLTVFNVSLVQFADFDIEYFFQISGRFRHQSNGEEARSLVLKDDDFFWLSGDILFF